MQKNVKDKELELEQFEDAATQIYSLIEVAKSYVDKNINIPQVVHIGVIIDRMSECAKVFENSFDAVKILKIS